MIVFHVEHHGDSLLFLHNAQGAENFKVSSCPLKGKSSYPKEEEEEEIR